MKNRYFGLVISIFVAAVSFTGYAQERYSLSGKVVDISGKSIPGGTIKLLNPQDSAVVRSAQANDGGFKFETLPAGSYLLRTSSIGFTDDLKAINLTKNIDLTLVLAEQSTALNEVAVSGNKQIFRNDKGNFKVNIESTVLAQVPDVAGLITKLPGVQLSPNGEQINIVGRGAPLIYLDNQRITLNDLASLSTQDIKTIEILHNPSSKYEAEGRSVLLITRSKSKLDGTKVALTTTNSFKRYFQSRNSANVNVKKNRLEFKGNVQYNNQNQWESNSNDFRIADENFATNYRVYSIGKRMQAVFSGGVYYEINDADYLSANVSKRYQDGNFTNTTATYIRQADTRDNVDTYNKNEGKRPLLNANVNYSKALKKLDGQLFLGAQYAQFAHKLTSNIYNDYNHTGIALSQERQQDYSAGVFAGRADFEKSFNKALKLESGTSISSATSDATLEQRNYDPAQGTASAFAYAEQIYGAYTQLSGKSGKANCSAGLRMENTNIDGNGGAASLIIKRNYTDFFPKASVDFAVTDSSNLSINYARSISRPDYAAMSQMTTYINPYFEWANNIQINPTIRQEVTATFQLKDNSISVSYYHASDPVYYAVHYDKDTRKLRMINTNYKSESGVNINLIVPVKSGVWTSTNTLTGSINKVKDPAALVNKARPYAYVYSNNEFKLPAGYTLMVSGWGSTKRDEGVFEHNASYAIDTALTKTFLKKLTATISYNSILSASEYKENFTINNVASKGIYYADVREVGLSLKYAFGNIKDSRYKNKEIDANMNRIR
jgi:hypothetical protein